MEENKSKIEEEEVLEETKDTLNYDEVYDPVPIDDVYVDSTNTVVTAEDLKITPFDVIKAHAEKLGQTIVDPNPSCNDCYGRGYIGRDVMSKAPIPCRCIQPDYNSQQNQYIFNRTRKYSRKERRQMMKNNKRG